MRWLFLRMVGNVLHGMHCNELRSHEIGPTCVFRFCDGEAATVDSLLPNDELEVSGNPATSVIIMRRRDQQPSKANVKRGGMFYSHSQVDAKGNA